MGISDIMTVIGVCEQDSLLSAGSPYPNTSAAQMDKCPAQRRAVQQYELVVRRLLRAETSVRKLQEETEALRKSEEKWQLEREKLKKLIEISREPPAPSRSLTSPAKKRKADSPLKEISSKRQRVDSISLYHRAAPATGRFHFSLPSKPNFCTTQVCPLKPAPTRRPGRPRDLTLNRELFKEVVEELRQEYPGAVLTNKVPVQSSPRVKEYLDNLWATARSVTKRDRRKVVTKHDIKCALYNRADIAL
ncbi:hypothetical protein CDAR_248341 [Caerostris darwini]|uniref:Uncharacterized protein n=1 Tax=Caerostris darwini TaxID=1538125 RepID=A0AAV4UDH1_9ARAC|nr:hypothetical protein CDAR_248341 [Caerostris darwini]